MIPDDQNLSRSAGPRQKVPSYVGISCVISGYAPIGRESVRNPSVTSPVRFDCPPLPTARDKHPHLFAPENEEERSKSLVQKKIECLYGREAGEEWSKCKPNQKSSSKNQTLKGASVPQTGSHNDQQQQRPQSDAAASGANGTPKKEYREAVFKRLDLDFIRQIDSDILNGNEQTRNGHVLMSPAEAIVQTRIQQLRLKSPSAPSAPALHTKRDREVDDGAEEVCNRSGGQRNECQEEEKKSEATASGRSGKQSETGVTDSRDGVWFLKKVDDTCDAIRRKIKQTESLMEEESAAISDEVEGKVRAVIGKADLLMTKKLNQFRELCLHNINQSSNEGFETKIQDLDGFWEMVSIQVQEVEKNFSEISRLHENNWIQPDDAQEMALGPKNRSRKNPSKGSPAKGVSVTEEAAAKEAVRKERLLQAKKKMQQERKASADETDVAIFVAETRAQESATPPHDPI